MSRIILPNSLNDDGALSLVRDLNQVIDEPEVSVCFDHLSWVRPFGTLVAAEAFKDFVFIRKDAGYKTYYENPANIIAQNDGAIGYLKYFGFFQYCGIDIGEQPNEDYHTKNYLRIQKLEQKELENNAKNGDWRNRIVSKCEELGEILCEDISSVNYLEYAFREIIRNVFEHAAISECSLMAQAYKNGMIEIAVADRGRGIYSTLKDKYNLDKPIDSLFLALEPGVSMEDVDNSPGEWGNSGFGLYILSNVGKEYGAFSLLSSGCYLRMYHDDRTILTDEVFYTGTAIKLLVNKADLEYFPNLRYKLIQEGELKYKEKYGKEIKASLRSGKSLH